MPASDTTAKTLKLGLIGDNIARSQSPRLHRLAGQHAGIKVTYDRLVPTALHLPFERVFADARAGGYRGLNITYPYKERVVALVMVEDPVLRAIGAVNTVIFTADDAQGFNTDFTGFKAAYNRVRGHTRPGVTLIIGTGGVGRAIAFGLADLGAVGLRLVDRDHSKAKGLAQDLRRVFPDLDISLHDAADQAATGVSGIVNATPVGMIGHDGTPLAGAAMSGADWAFDAVYTPQDTQFLTDAAAAGLTIVSGWELFFFQGLHAWAHFSGQETDAHWLRASLLSQDTA